MNGDRNSGQGSGFDDVEEFFARQRDSIVSGPGSDLHWQQVVREARARRRSRARGYVVGAAAAVVVVAGVAWGAVATQLGTGHAPVPASRTASQTPGNDRTTGHATVPAPLAVAPRPGDPVPADFSLTSLSNAGSNQLYAMGTGRCTGTGTRCPILAGSSDDGHSWQVVHVFADAPAPQLPAREGAVEPASTLSQVRFATPTVGWVFGGGLQVTRNGGQTWQKYPHPGDTVLDVVTTGREVLIGSASGCTAAGCQGQTIVSRAPIADQQAAVVLRGTSGRVATGLDLQFDRLRSLAVPQFADGAPSPVRLTDAGTDPVVTPAPCAADQPWYVATAADTSGRLAAFCAKGTAQGQTYAASPTTPPPAASNSQTYAVSSSADGGSTWQVRSTGALTLPAGQTSFTAARSGDLLAVSTGSGTGSMQVSHDGGATWQAPSQPAAGTSGWGWVGSPGGPSYYAIPAGGGGSYWQSNDLGQTWTAMSLVSQPR